MSKAEKTLEKCSLSTEELIKKCREWNTKLCKTGGDAWVLRVPVDINRDPDMIIGEVCDRLEEKESQLQELREQVEKAKAGNGKYDEAEYIRIDYVLELIDNLNG